MGADLPLHDVNEDYSITSERLESLLTGTLKMLEHPEYTAEDNHEFWEQCKKDQGYVYGPELDTVNKTHPSMVPYSELSEVEKRKDDMDVLMVKLCSQLFDMI